MCTWHDTPAMLPPLTSALGFISLSLSLSLSLCAVYSYYFEEMNWKGDTFVNLWTERKRSSEVLCSNYFHNIFTTNFNDKLLLILIWIHYNFISNFTIFFFTITYFLNIYTFFNFFSSLTFSSPHYPLSSTLYFNIAIHLSLHLPLFVSSYPFPFTIN